MTRVKNVNVDLDSSGGETPQPPQKPAKLHAKIFTWNTDNEKQAKCDKLLKKQVIFPVGSSKKQQLQPQSQPPAMINECDIELVGDKVMVLKQVDECGSNLLKRRHHVIAGKQQPLLSSPQIPIAAEEEITVIDIMSPEQEEEALPMLSKLDVDEVLSPTLINYEDADMFECSQQPCCSVMPPAPSGTLDLDLVDEVLHQHYDNDINESKFLCFLIYFC